LNDPTFPFPKPDQVPTKISPCTIVDTALEVQFNPGLPWAVMPGIIFVAIEEEFPLQKDLGLQQIPNEVRDANPLLRRQPHVEFHSADGQSMVRLGPEMISLNIVGPYPGWTAVRDKAAWLLNAIKGSSIRNHSSGAFRLGLRIVDFFPESIRDFLDMSVQVGGHSINPKSLSVNINTEKDGFDVLAQIHTQADFTGISRIPSQKGSIIDIDISTSQQVPLLTDSLEWFVRAHELNKEIFFGLIKKQKLDEFNPDY
jgi:uncharacterized protein (TIGR04255 family)